jgi:hypothetical protein
MGRLFFFLSKPDPLIADDAWMGFLDGMAAMAAIVVLATVGVTILSYMIATRRRKVYVPDDLFAPFTPMYSLLWAIAGALAAAVLCFSQYLPALESSEGRLGIAAQIALVTGVLCALISYLLIAFAPVTPRKYAYRPAAFLHKRRASHT